MSGVMNTIPHMPSRRAQRQISLLLYKYKAALEKKIVSVRCRSQGNSLPLRGKEVMLRHNSL